MGAGLGGVACAYEMKKKLGKSHEVTLVGSSAFFEFTPSNPWILVGWRTAPQTRVDLARAAGRQGRALGAEDGRGDRRAGLDSQAGRRKFDRLRLPGHHDRAEAGLRGDPGSWTAGPHSVGVHARARARWLGSLPEVRRGPGPDRGRCRAGSELLRPRLRDRDDPRHRPAPAQDSRPRADDLRDRGALHRPHGPRRRRRQQGADGIGAAAAPRPVDHQREDHRRRGRRDDRSRARRGRQA